MLQPTIEAVKQLADTLPGCTDLFFQRLWRHGMLRYKGLAPTVDSVDLVNAELIASAITRRERVVIVLPDLLPRRPPLLLATALLRSWYDSRTAASPATRSVLYFGNHVGIRTQLTDISIAKTRLDLRHIFRQSDLRRGAPHSSVALDEGTGENTLPRLTTVYAPPDPVALLTAYSPDWVALDLADAEELPWLRSLLTACRDIGIGVVGWSENPLGRVLLEVKENCHVWVWPVRGHRRMGPPGDEGQSAQSIQITPLLLGGAAAEELSKCLHAAAKTLGAMTEVRTGQFAADALASHWRWLRAIEALCVPLVLYEVEAPTTWGVRSIAKLRDTCERFEEAARVSHSRLADGLASASAELARATGLVTESDPPMWEALCALCIGAPAGAITNIVFQTRAAKRVFQFALLAKEGITGQELEASGVRLLTLRELGGGNEIAEHGASDVQERNCPTGRAILVGAPGPFRGVQVLRLAQQGPVDILAYPHCVAALRRRIDQWQTELTNSASNLGNMFSQLAQREVAFAGDLEALAIELRPAQEIETSSGVSKAALRDMGLVDIGDTVTEIADLLSDEQEDDVRGVEAQVQAAEVTDKDEDDTVTSAIRITFDQGWQGLFAVDEPLNVVLNTPAGRHLDERVARSLRPGDQVLLLHGQRRQNLYDLIIERLHRHPALEVHLALLERWHDDYRAAYPQWCASMPGVRRGLPEVLDAIQVLGSRITATITLQFWRTGRILSPSDDEDLRRLADVLSMPFVREHYKRIGKAAARIRALHRSLSARLNRWLMEEAAVGDARADDVVDEELGVTFGDFRSSLLLVRCVSTDEVNGLFLRSRLGLVNQGES